MIAVDTNILARFYCQDPDDREAKRQSPIARKVMLESPSIFVPLTVVLYWACSTNCDRFLTFDDKKFARRAAKLGFLPQVTLPASS